MNLNIVKYILLTLLTSNTLSANWTQAERFLKGEETSFGYSLDIDGRYAVVGAPDEDEKRGAVYIFKKDENGSFQSIQEISNLRRRDVAGEFNYKALGSDVAVSDAGGNNVKIIAGAPNTYYDLGLLRLNYNGVVIFDLNSSTNQFYLSKTFEESNTTGAGHSVDIVARKLILSTKPYRTLITGYIAVTGLHNISQVKTYSQSSATGDWKSSTHIHAGSEDKFAWALALRASSVEDSRIKLLVGAPGVDINGRIDRGKAYVYDLGGSYTNNLTWGNEEVLALSEGLLLSGYSFNSYTEFGSAVDIKNNRLIVGSSNRNLKVPFTFFTSGEARVYELSNNETNEWAPLGGSLHGSNIHALSDRFAMSVAIDTNTVLVGASGVGAVYSFQFDGINIWNETAVIRDEVGGNFGYALDMQGGKAMLGNPNNATVTSYKFTQESVSPSLAPIAIMMYLLN